MQLTIVNFSVLAQCGCKKLLMGHRMLEALVKLAFAITLLLVSGMRVVMAVNYVVGGAAGWGFCSHCFLLLRRATGINFVPGDTLSKTDHFKVSPLYSLSSVTANEQRFKYQ
jgi:hypothetical protein